jgi:hypothetical protein
MQPKMSLVHKLPAHSAAAMRRRSGGPHVRVLLLATLAAGLVACGGGTGSPSGVPEQSATLVPSVVPTASVSASPSHEPTATPPSGTFTLTGSPGAQLAGNAAVLLADGRVLVISAESSVAQVYDGTTGVSSVTGQMTVERSALTATVLGDGKVLVVGVASNLDSQAGDPGAELYDPVTGTFSRASALLTYRGGHTAIRLNDGRVLIAGGEGRPVTNDEILYGKYLASAEIYDPATGKFTATGSMHTAREDATATLLPDGRVLIAGGDQGVCGACGYINILASAEIYDPATGKFSTTGSMTTARTRHAASALADGRVLIAGGFGSNSPALASAEIYDPATGKWSGTGLMTAGRESHTATGLMMAARVGHTATRLRDGRVLVVGGSAEGAVPPDLSSAELYDPATATFSPTGDMHAHRSEHSATLLADGRVLIAGGEHTTKVGCELYWP